MNKRPYANNQLNWHVWCNVQVKEPTGDGEEHGE